MSQLKFIDNKEFLQFLKKYKTSRDRETYNKIGEILDNMAKKLLFSPKFINYTDDWKNEMYSEAMYNCVRYLDNFDSTERNNPFAYFTQVIWNSFLQVLNKEKKIKFQRQVIMDKVWDEVCPNGEVAIEVKEE